jgi:hypothetical protein
MIKKTKTLLVTENRLAMFIIFALITLTLGILLSSCSSNSINVGGTEATPIGDGGFLSEQPCGSPCFFGVIPGVTTKDNAIALLQSKGLYQDCTDADNSKENGIHEITCTYPTWALVVSVENNDNLVSGISFPPSDNITVEEVIAKYGQPTAVSELAIGPSGRDFDAYMILYYDRINTVIDLITQKNSSVYDVSPTTLVGIIEYYNQEQYQSRQQIIQSWKGYGIYKESNP